VEEQSKPITIKIIAHDKDIFRKPMYRYTLRGMEGQVILLIPAGTDIKRTICTNLPSNGFL